MRSRWIAGLAALIALPTLVAVDTAAALTRGFATRSRLDRAFLLGVGVWLALGVGLALVARGRAFLERAWARLLLAAVATALALLAAECSLRLLRASVERKGFHLRQPNLSIEFRPLPENVAGVASVARYTTESHGLRAREAPPRAAARRLLCLGGSTTECVYLDDSRVWTRLLEDELRAAGRPVWVAGAGISGYATEQHLRFLESSPVVSEFDTVLLLVGINDLVRFLGAEIPQGEPLWRRSELGRRARDLAVRASGGVRYQTDVREEDPEARNVAARRWIRAHCPVVGDPPGLARALEEYESRLVALAAAARRRGVRPVLATQPVLWDGGLPPPVTATFWLGELPGWRFLSVPRLREAMDAYNECLRRVAAREGTGLLELSALSGDPALFYDDCHFNEAGARAVARLTAAWFRGHPEAP